MVRVLSLLCVTLGATAGCSERSTSPKFRSYDMNVFHPSPYSTFVGVVPGGQGEALPRIEELESRDFNNYLRDVTGCTVQAGATSYPIGNERDPSGYMVPVSCAQGGAP